MERLREAADWVERAVNPVASLPRAGEYYLERRYRALGRIEAADRLAGEIRKLLQGGTPEDRQAAYRYLTTPGARPDGIRDPRVREGAVRAKQLIDRIGDELVRRGLLSPEFATGRPRL